MRLYTVGPVDMYDATLKIGGTPLPYFRTDEFSQIMLEIQNDILELSNAPLDNRVVLLTSSGTGAMDAAVANILSPKDKVLIVNGGTFGHRFVELCTIYSIPFDELFLKFDEELSAEKLRNYQPENYSALLVNLHETSTGQLYNIDLLSSFCKENNMILMVDAISSFLADDISIKKSNIDVLIGSSQKALALPPGLSFLVLSQRVIEERINKKSACLYYLNLKNALANMVRGQTPFTPAVGIILQLHERLESIKKKGVVVEVALHAARANHFRKLCHQVGLIVPDFQKSNALTPLYFPKENAYDLFLELKNKYKLVVTPNGGALKNKVLRVGHLGNKTLNEYDELVVHLLEF